MTSRASSKDWTSLIVNVTILYHTVHSDISEEAGALVHYRSFRHIRRSWCIGSTPRRRGGGGGGVMGENWDHQRPSKKTQTLKVTFCIIVDKSQDFWWGFYKSVKLENNDAMVCKNPCIFWRQYVGYIETVRHARDYKVKYSQTCIKRTPYYHIALF